jgi:transcriptional regulator with XRE-family HTH domain
MTHKEIRILMLQKGVTQAQIARDLNVTRAAICHVLKGELPSHRIRRAVAKSLRVPISRLWPPEKNKKQKKTKL